MSEGGRRAVRAAAFLLAALVLIPGAALAAGGDFDKPAPYVLITNDGYRVDAMEKPVREDGKVKIRLAPSGQLTIMAEGAIDWKATERFNKPRPAPAPVRKPVSTAEGARSLADSAGARPTEPIEMTIIGERSRVAASEAGGGDGDRGAAPGGVAPVAPGSGVPTDPAAVASELAELRRQMAQVKSTYDGAVKARADLEARLADLRDKRGANPAPSGVQDYQPVSQKAIAQVQDQLASVREQISALEQRMNDIRTRAVILGGVVD